MADRGSRPWWQLRASTAKVRSGCVTCKCRHVKCDEAKPTCNNCRKVGRICGGYQKPRVTGGPARKSTNSITVVDKSTNSITIIDDDPSSTTRRQEVASPSLLSNPAMTLFETETEHLYFDFFLHHTSHKLSGNVASVIWTSIVPKACAQDCSTRHAVVAIAALDKIADSAAGSSVGDCFGFRSSGAAEQYNLAVYQYNRALRAMGNELMASTTEVEHHGIRNILIFCLLTVCFESYIGNPEAANIQALTGNNLLSNWLQRERSAHCLKSGISSPAPNVLEDDLIHAFIRLRQRVGTVLPKDTLWTIMNEEDEAVKCMPPEFSDLREAKIFWEMVERRIERLRISDTDSHGKPPRLTVHDDSFYTFRSLTPMDPSTPNNSSVLEDHYSAIERWTQAFISVFTHSTTPLGSADYLSAAVVKIRSLIARPLCVGLLSCEDEMVYDEFHQDYVDILALAASVLHRDSSWDKKIRFRFDIKMVPALLYLVIFCRHRTLRRQGLTLLEAYPCREGSWDSSMAVSIGRWVIKTEEAAACPEEKNPPVWIPTDARVCIYSFSYSPLQCRGVLSYRTRQDRKFAATCPARQVELIW